MEPVGRDALVGFQRQVDARCREILAACPDWPCARGCDGCCRRLAEPPRATLAEWALLLEHLARVEEGVGGGAEPPLQARFAALGPRPITCPLLDEGTGECRVYAGRPLACRTYGFYRSGEAMLGCERVRARAEGAGELVFGNQDALDSRLASSLGPSLWMAEAFAALSDRRG